MDQLPLDSQTKLAEMTAFTDNLHTKSSCRPNALYAKLQNIIFQFTRTILSSPKERQIAAIAEIYAFYNEQLKSINSKQFVQKQYLAKNVTIDHKDQKESPYMTKIIDNKVDEMHRTQIENNISIKKRLRSLETRKIGFPKPTHPAIRDSFDSNLNKFEKPNERIISTVRIGIYVSDNDILKYKNRMVREKRYQEEFQNYIRQYGRNKSVGYELRMTQKEFKRSAEEPKAKITQRAVGATDKINKRKAVLEKLFDNSECDAEAFFASRQAKKTHMTRLNGNFLYNSQPLTDRAENPLTFLSNDMTKSSSWFKRTSLFDMKRTAEETFRQTFQSTNKLKKSDEEVEKLLRHYASPEKSKFNKYFLPKMDANLYSEVKV